MEVIRSITTTSIIELSCWCRRLHREQSKKADVVNRFAIGLYQLDGWWSWAGQDDTVNESLAAAVVHWLTVMEVLDLRIESRCACNEFDMWTWNSFDTSFVLHSICAAQKHIFYNSQRGVTQRGSRYDPKILEGVLGDLCVHCLSNIPQGKRSDAIYAATDIMTRRL